MINTPNNKTITKFVDEVIMPAGTATREQTRGLGDLPADLSPGAREVSMLTAISRAHAKALPQVHDALNKLASIPNWSGSYLVADKADYDWRTAPWRRYESFADFYERECATVWGAWADLQATYQDLISGKINTNEAETKIHARAEEARRAVIKNAPVLEKQEYGAGKAGPGRGKKTGSETTCLGRGTDYLATRLKRDHPDIAARIDEFPSMKAAARAAGIIKDMTRLEKFQREWRGANTEERAQIIAWIKQQEAI